MGQSQRISASVGCGFHVQIPSDADVDADLLRDQNIIATAIQLTYLKLNSCKRTSSEQLK